MFRSCVIVDAVGALALVTMVGCMTASALRTNLQPFVAAAGQYTMMARPPVVTDGCETGCKCNGTGTERSGDGLSEVNCRCPETCRCKRVATKGGTSWKPKSLPR